MSFFKVTIKGKPILINTTEIINVTPDDNGGTLITTTEIVKGQNWPITVDEDFKELESLLSMKGLVLNFS